MCLYFFRDLRIRVSDTEMNLLRNRTTTPMSEDPHTDLLKGSQEFVDYGNGKHRHS